MSGRPTPHEWSFSICILLVSYILELELLIDVLLWKSFAYFPWAAIDCNVLARYIHVYVGSTATYARHDN